MSAFAPHCSQRTKRIRGHYADKGTEPATGFERAQSGVRGRSRKGETLRETVGVSPRHMPHARALRVRLAQRPANAVARAPSPT